MEAVVGKALLIVLCIGVSACSSAGDRQTEKFVYASGRPSYGFQPGKDVVATLWQAGEYGYVRIVTIEGAAQGSNDQPVNLTPEQIREAFSRLQIQKNNKEPKPLFTERELNNIAKPLAQALAEARPDQDISFAVADREGGVLASVFSPLLMTTGRVFYKNGELNVILGTVQTPFESQLRATGVMPDFTPGSRNNPAGLQKKIVLGPAMQYASAGREDWIQINTASGLTAPGQIATGPSQPVIAAPPPQPRMPAPASSGTGMERGGSDYRSEDYYRQIETRLKGLKRLREQGLITEQEYQQKRQAIIDQL